MLAVSTRIAKLEQRLGGAGGPGHYVVLFSGYGRDDEVAALLAERSINPEDPRNEVINFVTRYDGHEGNALPVDQQPPARIAFIKENS